MTRFALAALPLLALTACTPAMMEGMRPAGATTAPTAPTATPATAPTAPVATTVAAAPAPRPVARATPAQLNTTTQEQRAEAAKPAATAETKLGTTVASLGDPTQPGFWIKTPLVQAKATGRIVNPATGKSAKVDLLPLAGGGTGSQVSLPALQLLGVSLTDLPRLEVYRS